MLHANLFVELKGFWDQVCVELVQPLIEERGEVLGQLVRLLEAGSEPIGEGCDVRHVVVLRELRLILDALFQADIVVKQPPEHRFLDLLVVLFLEEIVAEKLHGTQNEQLSPSWTGVECSYWSICGKTDWATRQ